MRSKSIAVAIAVCALVCGHANVAARYAAQAAPVAYTWRNVSVGGGGFAPGIVFSPVERGLAYLRTDMGGAYRWDARAGRWIALQDAEGESSFMGIESIAADPVDPKVVYIAAGMNARGPSAILRSADRGAHWTKVRVPFAMGGNEDGRGLGERLAIDPRNNRTLLYGSRHDGLWRSDDAALTWRKVGAFPLPGLGTPGRQRATHGGLSFVLFDPHRPGHIVVGSADPGPEHLFQSFDGGRRWSVIAGGPGPDLLPVKAAIGSDGRMTVTLCDGIGPNGITRGAVWQRDLSSGAWRNVTPDRAPTAMPGGYMGVSVSATDPRLIAVSTVDRYRPGDTVWLSRDGGDSWDELRLRSRRDVSATPFLDFAGKADFGHWISGLAIDPFDPGHAAYVTGATIYATDALTAPGAMTWTPWTRGIEQTAIITLTSPTGGAPLVSGFGDIGGFRHDDLSVSPPRVHRDPFLTNTNSLDYAGHAPQVMVRSGNTHAATVPDTSLSWSRDGGASWSPLRVPPDGAPGIVPPEATGNAAITVSADGRTFLVETQRPRITRDGGRTWAFTSGLPAGSRVTSDKSDPDRFYAIDFAAGEVIRSDDGGATFRSVGHDGLPADLSGARAIGREAANPLLSVPGMPGIVWLLVGSDLYRSTDFAAHWQRATTGIAIFRYGLGKAAPGARWPALYAIASVSGVKGVYRSIDGGARWSRINDDAHQWGLRLRVISGDPRRFGRVYLGTDGRGIVYGDPKGEGQ